MESRPCLTVSVRDRSCITDQELCCSDVSEDDCYITDARLHSGAVLNLNCQNRRRPTEQQSETE